MSDNSVARRSHCRKSVSEQRSKTEVGDQHLGNFEHYRQKGDIGQAFAELSLALCILPSCKDTYYSSYLEVFESWSALVEEKYGFKESMALFEVALKNFPDSNDIKHLLAKALYRNKMSMDKWRALFRECMSGHGDQYCDEVAPLLVAVDQGIKPSLLWDVCTADTTALLSLLNKAHAKGLLVSKLVLVELDLDVLIVNMTTLSHALVNISNATPTWLIDISESTPKVGSNENHQKFKSHLGSIISQLEVATGNENVEAASSTAAAEPTASVQASSSATPSNSVVKAVQVKVPSDLNLSTVFGCMLGYPHIYWWEGDSDGNSLSGMPLKVFKFSANCSVDGKTVELFSFSIPEALETDLRPGIERWGNVMNLKIEEANSFSNASFKCDSVLCLSVAL